MRKNSLATPFAGAASLRRRKLPRRLRRKSSKLLFNNLTVSVDALKFIRRRFAICRFCRFSPSPRGLSAAPPRALIGVQTATATAYRASLRCDVSANRRRDTLSGKLPIFITPLRRLLPSACKLSGPSARSLGAGECKPPPPPQPLKCARSARFQRCAFSRCRPRLALFGARRHPLSLIDSTLCVELR